MAYYAIVKDGIVDNVILSEPDYAVILVKELMGDDIIEVTDETKPAAIGHSFVDGKFIPPQPFESWIFDTEVWSWKAPVECTIDPMEKVSISWDEESLSWIATPIEFIEEPSV